MGRAMFTIIGAMAELESSLISERVTAGMRAAAARGERLGRPPLPPRLIAEIEALAVSTNLSVRQIHEKTGRKAGRGRVGEIMSGRCTWRNFHNLDAWHPNNRFYEFYLMLH